MWLAIGALVFVVIVVCAMYAMGESPIIHMFRPAENYINSTREITLHYTTWCPHCKTMKPVWESVKNRAKSSGIIFKEVDEDVAKTSGINGYPTIRMIDEHGHTSEYPGMPNVDALLAWALSPKKN